MATETRRAFLLSGTVAGSGLGYDLAQFTPPE